MQRVIRFLTLMILLIGCDIKSAKDYVIEAEKLEEKQEYQEAILLLDKAISIDNKFLGAYLNRGADKAAVGDFQGAISDYEKVIALDSANTLALYNIGNNYARLTNFVAAVDYYNKAFVSKGGQELYFDHVPNDFVDQASYDVAGHEIHYQRGVSFLHLDSIQLSYKDFQACIKKNYMTAESYYWIGQIYLKTGQRNFACDSFTKAKQLGDKDADEALKQNCNG